MAERDKKWEVSEEINVRDFLSKWSNDVYQYCAEDDSNEQDVMAKKMKMSVENVQELESVCSLDLLKTKKDHQIDKWLIQQKIPDDLDKLMCVRFQKQDIERRKTIPAYLSNVQRKMKYKQGDCNLFYQHKLDVKRGSIPEEHLVIYPDVLITVHINRPVKTKISNMYDDRVDQMTVSSVMQVLGRQKLTDLRDLVRCVNDLTVVGDLSENPDSECQTYAKDLFKSGFFFINDVFYNDMREDDCRDYSKVILDWASESSRNMESYSTKLMEDTTFLDLTLRLGQPYVYLHQGDCEHLIIFSDVRLLTNEDPQDVRDYPYLLGKSRRNRTMCRVCHTQAARWITYGSKFTPENPCFFCDTCFRCLHYDEDSKKIGNFEAYRYFDHHAIV